MNRTKNNVGIIVLGSIPLFLNGFYNLYLSNLPAIFVIVEIITWVFLPLSLYFYGVNKKLFSNMDLGFHTRIRDRSSLVYLLLLTPITIFIVDFLDSLARFLATKIIPINYCASQFNYANFIPNNGLLRYVILIYFILTAGFVEEFYYRGLMGHLFKKSILPTIFFIFISAIVWAAMHWEQGVRGIFSIFLLGIVFSFLYRFYGNIWPLLLSHIYLDYKWFS